jgi:hypothetical protein
MVIYGFNVSNTIPIEDEITFAQKNDFSILQLWFDRYGLSIKDKKSIDALVGCKIETVLHVAANIGEFGKLIDSALPIVKKLNHKSLIIHPTMSRGIKNKPLADHMPTILLKAKDFTTEITIFNAQDKHLSTEQQISIEHVTNNKSVRSTLVSRGIVPENLPPEEDIKKVERKLNSEKKKSLGAAESLKGN